MLGATTFRVKTLARDLTAILILSNSDAAPLSIAESSEGTLAPVTVSASSLPDLGEDGRAMVDISTFMTAEILGERSGPFGVEYWVPARAAVVGCRLGGTGADRTRSRPGSCEETYTSTPSRDIKGGNEGGNAKGNAKERVFTNISGLSGAIFTVSILPPSGLSFI
jgi:hypothetical protein